MNEMQADVPQITASQLKQMLDTGEPLALLDVREPFEWEISNLGRFGATLIPMGDVPARLDEMDRTAPVVVYCRTGARSDLIARYLIMNGFERVWNLDGGINAWARTEDPEMRRY
jgi:adenylyltransferase/sulfurtransferase